jgi:hypothetical protein
MMGNPGPAIESVGIKEALADGLEPRKRTFLVRAPVMVTIGIVLVAALSFATPAMQRKLDDAFKAAGLLE